MGKTLKAGKKQNDFRKSSAEEREFESKKPKMKPFSKKNDRL